MDDFFSIKLNKLNKILYEHEQTHNKFNLNSTEFLEWKFQVYFNLFLYSIFPSKSTESNGWSLSEDIVLKFRICRHRQFDSAVKFFDWWDILNGRGIFLTVYFISFLILFTHFQILYGFQSTHSERFQLSAEKRKIFKSNCNSVTWTTTTKKFITE